MYKEGILGIYKFSPLWIGPFLISYTQQHFPTTNHLLLNVLYLSLINSTTGLLSAKRDQPKSL